MSDVVIVAIPAQDDYVWKLSSEKVPHMTLLDIGPVTDQSLLTRITDFLQHVTDTMMCRFYLEVDHRGTLGPKDADVLFFDEDHCEKRIAEARTAMLSQTDIRLLFEEYDQYPEWVPHLTMGYPATPAKEDTREYPGVNFVKFDKIAIWTGDYSGVEFLLDDQKGDLYMSDMVGDILSHHGVKGMKWGVRKAERNSSAVTIRTKGTKVRTVGGKGHQLHPDAGRALTNRQIARKSGVHTLSNAELKHLVDRMNMEQQYKRLSGKPKGEGQRFAEEQLKNVGRQKIASALAKKAAGAAAVGAALA